MNFRKTVILIFSFLLFSGCTFNPQADIRVKSISPSPLTVTEASQQVTITIEVLNGVDIRLINYSIDYYDLNDQKTPTTRHAKILVDIAGGDYSDGNWTVNSGTLSVTVTYTDLIGFATDNNLGQMTAKIHIQGIDVNDNNISLDCSLTLLF